VLVIVYVAGASREMARAKNVIAELRARGFEIAEDWPAQIEAHGGRANEGLDEGDRAECARAAYVGVQRCNVLFLLVPSEQSAGAWFEVGAAVGLGRMVIASGLDEDFERSIFTTYASRRFSRGPQEARHGSASSWTYSDGRRSARYEMDARAIAWLEGYRDARVAEGSVT
jgi:hypothetical protein